MTFSFILWKRYRENLHFSYVWKCFKCSEEVKEFRPLQGKLRKKVALKILGKIRVIKCSLA